MARLGAILPREIDKQPFKVLDAPGLSKDFYHNVLDWSTKDVIAVGLESKAWLYNAAATRATAYVCETKNANDSDSDNDAHNVSCVAWHTRGDHLAIGSTGGDIQIWDVERQKVIRTFDEDHGRVGAISWSDTLLASGDGSVLFARYHGHCPLPNRRPAEYDTRHTLYRRGEITTRDTRLLQSRAGQWSGHTQNICGLKWSSDGQHLASGGNDNQVMIWSTQSARSLHTFRHGAAVKALAWSPYKRGQLCSGGGYADPSIRFWDTATGAALRTIHVGSQVCNLAWSANADEIVSTHGGPLKDQIVVWDGPSMRRIASLVGHRGRILYLATAPNGRAIVTGGEDETLQFRNVFAPRAKPRAALARRGMLDFAIR